MSIVVVVSIVFMPVACAVAIAGVKKYHQSKLTPYLALAGGADILLFIVACIAFGPLYAFIFSLALVMILARWLNQKKQSVAAQGTMTAAAVICVLMAMLSIGRGLVGCQKTEIRNQAMAPIKVWAEARMTHTTSLLAEKLKGHSILILVRSENPTAIDKIELEAFKKGLAESAEIVGIVAPEALAGGMDGSFTAKSFDVVLSSRDDYDMVVSMVALPPVRDLKKIAFFQQEDSQRPTFVLLSGAGSNGLKALFDLGWVGGTVIYDSRELKQLEGMPTPETAAALARKILIYVDAKNIEAAAKTYPNLILD